MITSIHNPKIKLIRSLQSSKRFRHTEMAFVVEGIRLVEEAIHSGWKCNLVIFTENLSQRGFYALDKFAEVGAVIQKVSPQVMKSASDTQSPQGILAVMSIQSLPLPKNYNFLLILDAVNNPGNLGTMLRTALSAKVDGVILAPGSVDQYLPKVVRAAMGAHFKLPIKKLNWEQISKITTPLKIFLSSAKKGITYSDADLTIPLGIIIGGETEGESQFAIDISTNQLRIPMPGGGESLNAGAAAAILMFEVVRQRAAIANTQGSK